MSKCSIFRESIILYHCPDPQDNHLSPFFAEMMNFLINEEKIMGFLINEDEGKILLLLILYLFSTLESGKKEDVCSYFILKLKF